MEKSQARSDGTSVVELIVTKAGKIVLFADNSVLICHKHSWDKLVAQLQDKYVPIEVGPVQRWGAHGSGTSIYFRDPEDNLIEARYYE